MPPGVAGVKFVSLMGAIALVAASAARRRWGKSSVFFEPNWRSWKSSPNRRGGLSTSNLRRFGTLGLANLNAFCWAHLPGDFTDHFFCERRGFPSLPLFFLCFILSFC